MSDPKRSERPIRILTIDNGGLQALSVLMILKQVCQAVAESDEWTAPYELFDVIAGVGTGGWLALLLGRYRLTLQQCATFYIRLGLAITPGPSASRAKKVSRNPAAIDQQRVIVEIDQLLKDRGLGDFLVDKAAESMDEDQDRASCHAFAVGVRPKGGYSLFRGYIPPKSLNPGDPDPRHCRVKDACAATAAAKDFMRECTLDGEVYWDEKFPRTHNITNLALTEADVLFGKLRPLGVVVNISPGPPNIRQVQYLRRAARNNATTTYLIKDGFSRLRDFTTSHLYRRSRSEPFPQLPTSQEGMSFNRPPRRSSELVNPSVGMSRTNTSNSAKSVSSQVIQQEIKFKEDIEFQLKQNYDNSSMYYRIAYNPPRNDQFQARRPYLNDVMRPGEAERMTREFLASGETTRRIDAIRESRSRAHHRRKR